MNREDELQGIIDFQQEEIKELLEACRQAFNESHNPRVEKILKDVITEGKFNQ